MLRQQFSKYDCVPISFLNALSFFYNKIPLQLEKLIFQHSLDSNTGTTIEGIYHITELINYNSKKVQCKFLEEEEITIDLIDTALNNHSIVLLKLNKHMILILKHDEEHYYCFDSLLQNTKDNINKKINKYSLKKDNNKVCIIMR